MGSVRLPADGSPLEDESHVSTDLSGRIQTFCKEQMEKRKLEWESIRVALDKMKEDKGKQHKQQTEGKDVTYSQLARDIEKTRLIVRNLISRASMVSAEE